MNKAVFKEFITSQLGIKDCDAYIEKFNVYEELLLMWNEKFNLTAITDSDAILEKHFIDSLYSMKYVTFAKKSLCDIGTGAGFPGIPLAIVNPTLDVTLVESNNKKCSFLKEVVSKLNLTNVHVVTSRAEELVSREAYDYVSARAVTSLNVLLELSIPLLKVKGSLLAYKLFEVEDEIKDAAHALKVLDAKVTRNEKYELPISGTKHSFVEVTKLDKTKKKYPRRYSEISASPL